MKFLIIMLVCACTLCCCSQTDELEDVSKNEINLTAPSGDVIASSITALKNEIMPFVAEICETDRDVKIENIQYAFIDYGYVATISFVTDDGIKRTIIKTDKVPFEIEEGARIKKIRNVANIQTRTENQVNINGMLVICNNPSPDCNCTPVVKKREDGGIAYTCNEYCDDCDTLYDV